MRRPAVMLLAVLVAGTGCGPRSAWSRPAQAAPLAPADSSRRTTAARAAPTFERAATVAAATLEQRFYHGSGTWNACLPARCGTLWRDWGADALTYALYLRWHIHPEPVAQRIMRAITATLPSYEGCRRPACSMWSDVPMWDAIAAVRAFEVTRRRDALAKAVRAFEVVDRSDAFARGACPEIDYQQPGGGGTHLKTLETDANYIKAALLLAASTGRPRYLRAARAKYAAVRRYFRDPAVPLYSVYVFDDGRRCRQLPHRFFGSVNGTMIFDGLALGALTGERGYARDARATAAAVARDLSDPSGIYADLQAENDTAEPLIESMYDLATREHSALARHWLLLAAGAAHAAPSGGYGRFFDGPAPAGAVSAWASSGGLALALAAGALAPRRRVAPDAWARGRFVAITVAGAPAALTFTGQAIALIGTIGDVCCEAGHVRVLVDGTETFDRTGIWQNKSSSGFRLPDSVLWSWRWPRAGTHTIAFAPGGRNAKEGGSFLHLTGYEVLR